MRGISSDGSASADIRVSSAMRAADNDDEHEHDELPPRRESINSVGEVCARLRAHTPHANLRKSTFTPSSSSTLHLHRIALHPPRWIRPR